MTILIEYDPNKKYPNASEKSITQSMGLLPPWFIKALNEEEKSIWDSLTDSYGFGKLYEINEAKIDEDNHVYSYPEDPSFEPIAVFQKDDKKIVFYPHAIVAVKENSNSEYRVTRMD